MPLPTPEIGLVLRYEFLWPNEAADDADAGLKTRPCAIVLMRRSIAGRDLVVVAPITHRSPEDPRHAVEIPRRVKDSLGLDDERSWIVVTDLNSFRWPGYDIRRLPGRSSRFDYGVLPPKFFRRLKAALAALRPDELRIIPRD